MQTTCTTRILALVCAAAALPLHGQSLPAGDYALARLDFLLEPQHRNLRYAHLADLDWTSSGTPAIAARVNDSSIASQIGPEFSVTVTGNPFLRLNAASDPEDAPPRLSGFINADASLFQLSAIELPSRIDPQVQQPALRFGVGMRKAAQLAAADVVGQWNHIAWFVRTAEPSHEFLGAGYSLAAIQINPDHTGVRTVLDTNLEDSDTGTISFTWQVDGGELLVVEPGLRLQAGATRDFLLNARIDRDGGDGKSLIFELLLKPAAGLATEELAGVWGMQTLELWSDSGWWGEARGVGLDKGLLELRPDGTGTYFLMATSFNPDEGDGKQDFRWRPAGDRIVATDDRGNTLAEVLIAAGRNVGVFHEADVWGTNFRSQKLDLLVRLGATEVPKPVRYIPLYEPVRDGWGRIGFAGWAYTALWPWVYSANLGWLYFTEGDGRRIWMHDARLGWLLTGPRMFPFFFGPGDNEVYYLEVRGPVTPDARRFYAYHTGNWID